MARRHLVIERPSASGTQISTPIRVQVDEQVPIGPWVATLAAHCGYPLVDRFGTPIPYCLRPVSGDMPLPTAGRFADIRFPADCRFVLEPERRKPVSVSRHAAPDSVPVAALHMSRRFMMSGSLLTLFSLLGFGSGMTTAFAQRLLRQKSSVSTRRPIVPRPFTLSLERTFSQHQQTVRTLTWSPDGAMVASGGNDDLALVWKRDGTVLSRLPFHAHVRAVAWSPDGAQLVSGTANTISFFDARTGSLLAENAAQHVASITSVGWIGGRQATDPLAVSAGTDKKAIIWDGQSHQPRVVFQQHTTPIEALALLADVVATASQGGVVRLWDAISGQEVHGAYADTKQPLRSVAFAATGVLAIGGDDGIVRLWRDGRTCEKQRDDAAGLHCDDVPTHLQGHSGSVRALAFSPDGMLLATGGDDQQLILWSMQTLTPVHRQSQSDACAALAWSPSGQFLAGALGSHVVLWHRSV